MLEINTKAPEFTLSDQFGNLRSLSEFKGKKVIVYFYPKDNTPGCSKQACAFRDTFERFKKDDIIVIGISKDTVTSHQKFTQKFELPFILLADTELNAIQSYDVWKEKKLYGKTYMGVVRSTYILDEDGMIIKVFPKANPSTNPTDILDYLDTYRKEF